MQPFRSRPSSSARPGRRACGHSAKSFARVEAELASMRADAAARAFTLHSETSTGSPTANLLRQLETRQAALRSQIENIEEEARHAGALAGWLR